MILYQTPGGVWCGTQKDWADAMKAEGFKPSAYQGRRDVDVPTDKKGLLEFLTFHHVAVIEPDVFAPTNEIAPAIPLPVDSSAPVTTVPDLDALFEAAPLRQKLRLAVTAIDAADRQIVG